MYQIIDEEIITDEDVRIHWNTHAFSSDELPICKLCGLSPIGLGMWGDNQWRMTHQGWKKPCSEEFRQ